VLQRINALDRLEKKGEEQISNAEKKNYAPNTEILINANLVDLFNKTTLI
jgi:hypothetical protein